MLSNRHIVRVEKRLKAYPYYLKKKGKNRKQIVDKPNKLKSKLKAQIIAGFSLS